MSYNSNVLATTNKRTCHCINCGRLIQRGMGIGTESATTSDGKKMYFCHGCYEQKGYHASKIKEEFISSHNSPFSCGIEFECSAFNDIAKTFFIKQGITATSDCSLNGSRTCEYVTPTYFGKFASPTKVIKSIGEMLKKGDIEMNESCGTHFHSSYNNMGGKMNAIRRNAKYIFGAMEEIMVAHNDTKTKEFFGRNFDLSNNWEDDSYSHYYEKGVNGNDWRNRYHWVNLTHNNRIEFRINKFVSGTQYQKLCMFERTITKEIVEKLVVNDDGSVSNENAKALGERLAKLLLKAW